MKTRSIIIIASVGLALFMIFPTTGANAEYCYYCNPLLFPSGCGRGRRWDCGGDCDRSFLSLLWTLLLCSSSTSSPRLLQAGALWLQGMGSRP